jgi:tetratricopeptide (TPR) repeat protein
MVYSQLGKAKEAERCFQLAIDQWSHRKDIWNLANSLSELGHLYLLGQQWTEAEACLDEAWARVGHKEESMYASLQEELVERRHKLATLTRSTN